MPFIPKKDSSYPLLQVQLMSQLYVGWMKMLMRECFGMSFPNMLLSRQTKTLLDSLLHRILLRQLTWFSLSTVVQDLRLVRDKFTHVSRGFAFVHFCSVGSLSQVDYCTRVLFLASVPFNQRAIRCYSNQKPSLGDQQILFSIASWKGDFYFYCPKVRNWLYSNHNLLLHWVGFAMFGDGHDQFYFCGGIFIEPLVAWLL